MNGVNKGSNGNLVFDSVENIGGHYTRTLCVRRENFLRTFRDRIAPALRKEHPGMSEEDVKVFKRKWEVNTLSSSSSSLSPRKSLEDWHDQYKLVLLCLLRGRVQSQDPERHYLYYRKRRYNGAIRGHPFMLHIFFSFPHFSISSVAAATRQTQSYYDILRRI